MADQEFDPENSADRFSLRDFSEAPRPDSAPVNPNFNQNQTGEIESSGASEIKETLDFGNQASTAGTSAAGNPTAHQQTDGYGLSWSPAESSRNFQEWSGEQKRRLGGAAGKLREKNSTIKGLLDFEFKNFMTISHVQAIYKSSMILGGILWVIAIILAFSVGTYLGISGIGNGSPSLVLISIIVFVIIVFLATSAYLNFLVRKRLTLEERVATVRIAQNTGDMLDKMR